MSWKVTSKFVLEMFEQYLPVIMHKKLFQTARANYLCCLMIQNYLSLRILRSKKKKLKEKKSLRWIIPDEETNSKQEYWSTAHL